MTIQPWTDLETVGVVEAQPGCQLNGSSEVGCANTTSNSTSSDVDLHRPGLGLTCVAMNVLFMVAMMIYQRYKLLEVPGLVLVFWCWVVGTVLAAVLMLAIEHDELLVDWTVPRVLYTAGHGFAACFFTIFNLLAINKTSTLVVQLASSLQIVFMLIGQYTVLININPGHYNVLEGAGVVIILIGSSLVSVHGMITKTSPRQ